MAMDQLLEQVKDAVLQHSNQQQDTGFDPSALLGQIENLKSGGAGGMAQDLLMQQVKDAVLQHSGQQQDTGFDPSSLLNHIGDLFDQHAQGTDQQSSGKNSDDDDS